MFSLLSIGIVIACLDQPEAVLQPSDEILDATAPAILLAVGDIAGCPPSYQDEETAELIADLPGTVAVLGDVVYEDGLRWQFRNCYDPSWGRVLDRTRPSPGNHEYRQAGAWPYYEYFGSRAGPEGRGYYTYRLGAWRIYSLNSERNIAKQTTWLTSHLADHPSRCILAYWHKPRYTSGEHPGETAVQPLFDALYRAGAEVVLSGHNHNYERFAPQDADANFQSRGTRQFVVGTGGAQLEDFVDIQPNSKLRYVAGWGVLRMTLSPGKYSWNFVPVPGSPPGDTGWANCT
ncbi:MAG: metallophosphoesterase family protein [Gemmatimonadales bacterium]